MKSWLAEDGCSIHTYQRKIYKEGEEGWKDTMETISSDDKLAIVVSKCFITYLRAVEREGGSLKVGLGRVIRGIGICSFRPRTFESGTLLMLCLYPRNVMTIPTFCELKLFYKELSYSSFLYTVYSTGSI